jgi:hypothetical protein
MIGSYTERFTVPSSAPAAATPERQTRSRPETGQYSGEQGSDVDGLTEPQHIEALPCVVRPQIAPGVTNLLAITNG